MYFKGTFFFENIFKNTTLEFKAVLTNVFVSSQKPHQFQKESLNPIFPHDM